MSLTKKQELFCQEYLIDLNSTKAVERAGFNPKNENVASSVGYNLLRKAEIQSRIQELMEARGIRTQITADKVLNRIARQAFALITDVCDFDETGVHFKNSSDLSEDELAAIASINCTEVTTVSKDGTETKTVTKSIKLRNNDRSLELLAKHTGLTHDLNTALATLRNYGFDVHLDMDNKRLIVPSAMQT
ncbi:MAG: terminase small subunit [Cyanobacteria bacterium J06623_1]